MMMSVLESTVFGAVLDDVKSDRKNLARSLKGLGAKSVNEAERPDDLEDEDYEYIIVDMYYFGKLLGPDFCSKLRSRFPRSWIIAVSGEGDESRWAEDAVKSGADFSVTKGAASPLELKRRIEEKGAREGHEPGESQTDH